jgi:Icc-related predicted phosphoesterase
VRNVAQKYQPLVQSAKHIHRSRGLIKVGHTTLINPGSGEGKGILRGCIFLEPTSVIGHQMTAG